MDQALKQRLIGAAVLVALAMIFLPMLLQEREDALDDAARVSLEMPAAPDQDFETRELPLLQPVPPAEGEAVLGLEPDDAGADPDAVVMVEPEAPAPRQEEPAAVPGEGPMQAVDAATGEPLAGPAEATPAATPPPAPAPAPPLPPTTAGGAWAVNVGSFSHIDNARALAQRLRAQGLQVSSESVDVNGKPALRLRVGPYAERALAEAARLRVEGVSGSPAAVVALAAEATPAPARSGAAPEVGFAVQLGALSSEADAIALRDRARAAGFVAFHQRVNTERGPVWRVRVGPEADRAAAEKLKDRVVSQLGLREAIVVPHP
ncbi:MAG TPA: SPOR domain-containing protein [Arenimonas sp.]|nr:SPOR domain-containing protein [Arenimonas sp.]